MSYVDGFVAAVPKENKQAFIDHARHMAAYFKKWGALKSVENWGDDVPLGEVTSFPMAVKCAEGETVVFSWVVWPSKEVRDAGWAKIMEETQGDPVAMQMPFDGKRMIYGGFETIFEG